MVAVDAAGGGPAASAGVADGLAARVDVSAEVLSSSEVSGWDVGIAGLVIILSVIAARLTARAVRRVADRLEGVSPGLRRAAVKVAAYAVLLIGLGVALSALGADVQPLQTAAIIAAVVAFLALRGVTGQFVAGVVVRTTTPYRVGDHVETAGHVGVVREITALSTVVDTYDGRRVCIPNLDAVSNSVVNRSACGALRVDVEVRAWWSGPRQELSAIVRDAAVTAPDVLANPETRVLVRSAEPGRVSLLVRPWHAPELDSDVVAGDVALAIGARLEQLGISHTAVTPPPPPPFTPMPQV